MDSMDFHSLSRRELQTLCKKNKIPANMTNIAMADALTDLTNVIGIEEIGQSESSMPETPLTSRRTTIRKTATKPQAVEPESIQTLTRPRRATAKKINKDEDSKDLREDASANATPAPRTGRPRVTGTSVCRKLDAQTQEVKEERHVVHAYSTRRSSRLQSAKKISESVQKIGERRTEAVMIAALSEEETDDVQMKSNSDAIVEVQENKGASVMVLVPIPDDAQEDLISDDASSAVVSADVSSSIEEVSSANQDMISESKDEGSSSITDVHVSEISVSEITLLSDCKAEITFEDVAHADQDMSFEDIASDDLHNVEVKEEPAVEVYVISPSVSTQKTALIPSASPLEKNTHDLEKPNVDCVMGPLSPDQVDDMSNDYEVVENNESFEVEKTVDSELKFSFEDELSDIQSEVRKSPMKFEVFDFGNMKETMDYISDLEKCNQVAVPLDSVVLDVIELENEKLDGDEMQECQTGDLPVLHLTNATVPSPRVEAQECSQFKLDVSIPEKCDSIADDKDVKADLLRDDASTDDEGSDNESDDSEESDDNYESDEEDESDDNDEIHGTPVAALVNSQNPVTPLKSTSAKKIATPNSRMMIKVLEDTEENNKSGKISLKSNSKVLISGVAEEKENSDNNKGESTAQKSLKKKSLRQLKKMLTQLTISDNNKTMGKEDLQVQKRSALQMLNENCLENEK